jgi:hypothetical protein
VLARKLLLQERDTKSKQVQQSASSRTCIPVGHWQTLWLECHRVYLKVELSVMAKDRDRGFTELTAVGSMTTFFFFLMRQT